MNNISWQTAQELLFSRALTIGTETLQLSKTNGRRLAQDVLADRDFPPHQSLRNGWFRSTLF